MKLILLLIVIFHVLAENAIAQKGALSNNCTNIETLQKIKGKMQLLQNQNKDLTKQNQKEKKRYRSSIDKLRKENQRLKSKLEMNQQILAGAGPESPIDNQEITLLSTKITELEKKIINLEKDLIKKDLEIYALENKTEEVGLPSDINGFQF